MPRAVLAIVDQERDFPIAASKTRQGGPFVHPDRRFLHPHLTKTANLGPFSLLYPLGP